MREIKFRVWSNRKKGYLNNERDNPNDNSYHVEGSVNEQIYCIARFLGEHDGEEDAILEQYTGLTDKNGVEIYEGDIVKTTGDGMYKFLGNPVPEYTNGKIEFFNSAWQICQKKVGSCGLGNYTCCDGEHEEGSLEVIGNIHENPELLEK